MASEVENVLRTLTMLEKALDRPGRSNYLDRKQYPPIFLAVEEAVHKLKLWIKRNGHLSSLKMLYLSLSELLASLTDMVAELWDCCKPKPGKKALKQSCRLMEKQSILRSIRSMLSNLNKSIKDWLGSAHGKFVLLQGWAAGHEFLVQH